MEGMSLKEQSIVAFLGVLVAYALAVGTWFFYAEAAWAKGAKAYDRAKKTFASEEALIAKEGVWTEKYEAERAKMPFFSSEKSTDTTWLAKMDEIAVKHNVFISQRQGGKEIEAGEVLELPIEVKNWECGFESLVRFMHEIENTDEGMFDFKQLNFKPSSKKGYLKGSFTLTCAYMREE